MSLYYASRAYTELAPATRAMRRALLERFRRDHGDKRIGMMQPQHVADLLDHLGPHPQRNMLKALRGLMSFAFNARTIDADPTAGYRLTRAKDRGGFKTWTDDDIAAFAQSGDHTSGRRRLSESRSRQYECEQSYEADDRLPHGASPLLVDSHSPGL